MSTLPPVVATAIAGNLPSTRWVKKVGVTLGDGDEVALYGVF